MITVVYGLPGAGKGALMTSFVKNIYKNQGRYLLSKCKETLKKYNEEFNKNLNPPNRVPIYTDYKVQFPIGYKKHYETYFLNGYYFGLENDNVPVIHVPPFSAVFLTEVQRYYDSRKSSTLKEFVSRLYEMHRHNNIDIYLDLQRLGLLDLNIRDLAKNIILVEELVHEYDGKKIVSSVWNCKEFSNVNDADRYFKDGAETFVNTKYYHKGNIFLSYDSFSNKDKFIPTDKYTYLEHDKIEQGNEDYYKFSMPEYYRKDKKPEKA